MIAASFIGIFVIPPLYVMFQGLRERAWSFVKARGETPPAARLDGAAGTPEHLPAE